jgi:hypothetical protein
MFLYFLPLQLMTKFLSIFISFLILFQGLNINLDEFTQQDELVEHAFYHAEKYDDDIFISKHYGELKEHHNKTNDEEKRDHEQLPFNHSCCPNYISVFILEGVLMPVLCIYEISSRKNFLYQETNSFFEKSSIFQPPKIA